MIQLTRDERDIMKIAREKGVEAEIVREGWQLVSDDELGARVIIDGGEIRELRSTNNEMEF